MTTSEKTADELRRIIKRLHKLEDTLRVKCNDAESREAQARIYKATDQLLIAAHYLEGRA